MDAQLRVSESTRNQEATLCLFLFFIQLLLACNPQSTTKNMDMPRQTKGNGLPLGAPFSHKQIKQTTKRKEKGRVPPRKKKETVSWHGKKNDMRWTCKESRATRWGFCGCRCL